MKKVNIIDRIIEKRIIEWIDGRGEALFISGARQVGKTHSIRKCLLGNDQSSYKYEINLARDKDMLNIVTQSGSVDDFIFNLSMAGLDNVESGATIIYIDDAQECSGIVEKVIDWADEGRCRFIVSGVFFDEDPDDYRRRSIESFHMYPLDFEEYLIANGLGEDIASKIYDKFRNVEPLAESTHRRLMELFQRYLLVGGMPAAVAKDMETGDLEAVASVQEEIIELYRQHFSLGEKEDKKLHLAAMHRVIPQELLKTNRRFRFADIDKRLKAGRAESTLSWHERNQDVISVYSVSSPRSPLRRYKESNLVKLYLSDVGLLNCMLRTMGDNVEAALYENAVVQELTAHGCQIYYYSDHTLGELDLLIEHDGDPLPIEVKSGKNYYRHSAVKHVTGRWEYRIPRSIVLSDDNVSRKDDIIYYPVYMAMFIKER